MKKAKENATLIFRPLKEKKTIKIFLVASILMALLYFLFGTLVTLFTFKPFPEGSIFITFGHAASLTFTSYLAFDLVIIVLYAIVGGLLYANYSYWKCNTNKTANAGLVVGLIAATACPACALPLIGLTGVVGFLSGVGIYLKFGVLALLISSIYYVAITRNKAGVCEITV